MIHLNKSQNKALIMYQII